MLPTVELYDNADADVLIEGPGTSVFDFSTCSLVKVISVAMGITKLSSSAVQLEIVNSGADLLIHFLKADVAGKRDSYKYQVLCTRASKEFDTSGYGYFVVKPAA